MSAQGRQVDRWGRCFEDGLYVDGVIDMHRVFVKTVSQKDGTLCRLILPDIKGKFPSDPGCNPLFWGQLFEPPYIPGGYHS